MEGSDSLITVKNSQRLYYLFLFLTIGFIAFCIMFNNAADPIHLFSAIVLIILAAYPFLNWLKNSGSYIPIFEIFSLTTLNLYAIPILDSNQLTDKYDTSTISNACYCVIIFHTILNFSYFLSKWKPGKGPIFTRAIFPTKIRRYIGYGLTVTTAYTIISEYTFIIPPELVGTLRAVFSGLGMICTFLAMEEWGKGNLHVREKCFLSFNLIIQVIVQILSLFLISSISILLLGCLGYIFGSKRFPWIPIFVIAGIFSFLHQGKAEMRNRYWGPESVGAVVPVAEIPSFFATWITLSSNPPESPEPVKNTASVNFILLRRASLFQMLCLVVDKSPSQLPFLAGETYADIPGQFIPRYFWPDKPRGHISTYRLGQYYGLQSLEGTYTCTIAFGLLPEAYANFGIIGCAILGLVFGLGYKCISCLCRESSLMSYAGLFVIVILAWTFQTEFTMSIWLSSLAQSAVVVIGLPFVLRNIIGD